MRRLPMNRVVTLLGLLVISVLVEVRGHPAVLIIAGEQMDEA